eukprot:6205363-Pleurochrysis_carterae.AAC.1
MEHRPVCSSQAVDMAVGCLKFAQRRVPDIGKPALDRAYFIWCCGEHTSKQMDVHDLAYLA